MIDYKWVSMAAELRDYEDINYINKEHKMLVDIAHAFWNEDLCYEDLDDEHKCLYDIYGQEPFFAQVFNDMDDIDHKLRANTRPQDGINKSALSDLSAEYNSRVYCY
jgi:hypothetical protein